MKIKILSILTILIILIVTIYYFFKDKRFEGILINEIYLSPNGKEILYVYENNNSSSIYKFKFKDSIPKLLIKKENWNLSQPSYSIDEKKIIYRAWQKNNPVISIFTANADGSNPKEIYKDSLLFDPKFSKYNIEEIIFVKANDYSNHSPFVRELPNGMDLYSFNLKNKQIKKQTNNNYYSINYYDFIDINNFVINSTSEGVFVSRTIDYNRQILNLANKNIDSNYLDQLFESPLSYSPVLKKYLLSTFHELYMWNGTDKKLEKIYTCELGKTINSTSFFACEDKILISSNEIVTIINYSGKIINRIKIPIPPLPRESFPVGDKR